MGEGRHSPSLKVRSFTLGDATWQTENGQHDPRPSGQSGQGRGLLGVQMAGAKTHSRKRGSSSFFEWVDEDKEAGRRGR